jgi:hypothetical protein
VIRDDDVVADDEMTPDDLLDQRLRRAGDWAVAYDIADQVTGGGPGGDGHDQGHGALLRVLLANAAVKGITWGREHPAGELADDTLRPLQRRARGPGTGQRAGDRGVAYGIARAVLNAGCQETRAGYHMPEVRSVAPLLAPLLAKAARAGIDSGREPVPQP